MKLNTEPTLSTIDDYDNKESAQKRKNVHLIILSLVVFAAVLSYVKMTNNTVSDYIGTENNPGINLFTN
jgi:hypothetical protein